MLNCIGKSMLMFSTKR